MPELEEFTLNVIEKPLETLKGHGEEK